MPTKEEIIASQKSERTECLKKILESQASKKIIVAGAGTGKTFTFKELLKANGTGENIALTFIRKLTSDMFNSFGDLAEVKTFHSYCKKVLHQRNGKVDIYSFLTNIIEEDALYLGLELSEFDEKFELLQEDSEEIGFYLTRGDYYEAVSFNDSVYRLYKLLLEDDSVLPAFNQILIDEFQDFNPLEVAFINELEKKGNILIVGDDDQAVYDYRNASSSYLRRKYNSKEYEIFELPFCTRCPEVVVKACNNFLSSAVTMGHLRSRIQKRYECFIDAKIDENEKYKKIITAYCTTGAMVAKYIKHFILKIDDDEIAESWKEGNEYPTVLIVGPGHYLKLMFEKLQSDFPQIQFEQSTETTLNQFIAYDILLKNQDHNLGWRLLINFHLDEDGIREVIGLSNDGALIKDILDAEFIGKHLRIIEKIRVIQNGEELEQAAIEELNQDTDGHAEAFIDYFEPKEELPEIEIDKSKPSILLKTFVGCKGLSSGFTFIIGANNGSIPKDPSNITEFEISQFLVAMTRTRKQCHIISDQWFIAPVDREGNFIPRSGKTRFLQWLPSESIEDKGTLSAKEIKASYS